VVRELLEFVKARLEGDNTKKLSLHTRIVLTTTFILITTGAILIFLLEFKNPDTLGVLPFRGKILASLFQSITPRTAGFSTLNTANLNPTTLLLLIVLMFIGASPGSTGGGVKNDHLWFDICLLKIKDSRL